MTRPKLCLAVCRGFGRPVEDLIHLFGERGFDGFFASWFPGEDITSFKKAADESNMLFQSVHAPFGKAQDMWKEEADLSCAAIEELNLCLEQCAKVEVPILVVHAYRGFTKPNPTAVGIDNFGQVVRRAEQLGIQIAFENTEGEEYLDALMSAFRDCRHVGFCWDSGHEMCYNRGRNMLASYGNRLLSTHLNDNLGIRDITGEKITSRDDLHLLPFDGITDWDFVASELVRCDFTDTLTFELLNESKPNRHENDRYQAMPLEDYLTEAYMRATRVGAMVQRKANQK